MDGVARAQWTDINLGAVIDIFDHKRVPLSGKVRATRQGAYPYYGASGIIDYIDDYIFDGKYLLVAEDGENLNSRKLPVAFFADGKFWVNNHAHIVRGKPGVAHDHFLYSWFAQANISGYITGAAQPKLSQENLKRIELRLPPYPMQRKIAAILSAYDDLIENNLRRIKILEEMAQNLYREWFVKFRFPGHQQARFVDSPLGAIPEGWNPGVVNDLLSLKSGFAFKSSTFSEAGKYELVTIKNVHDGVFVPDCTSRISIPPPNMPMFCHLSTGDILLSLTGNIGRTCLVFGSSYLLNQRVAKLVPHRMSNRGYVYLTFRQSEFQVDLARVATGVAQQNLSPVQTGQLQIVIPPEGVLSAFADNCEPVINKIIVLFQQNAILRRTRDLVLPKLISGELDVSELDIAVPGEVA